MKWSFRSCALHGSKSPIMKVYWGLLITVHISWSITSPWTESPSFKSSKNWKFTPTRGAILSTSSIIKNKGMLFYIILCSLLAALCHPSSPSLLLNIKKQCRSIQLVSLCPVLSFHPKFFKIMPDLMIFVRCWKLLIGKLWDRKWRIWMTGRQKKFIALLAIMPLKMRTTKLIHRRRSTNCPIFLNKSQ